jgi:hypothetical protein
LAYGFDELIARAATSRALAPPFLEHGDPIELCMDKDGSSAFGTIGQTYVIG